MKLKINKQLIEEYFDFLDGRQTIYHGTSPENKKEILQNGLQGQYTGQVGSATGNVLNGTIQGEDSKNKVFTTSSKWGAAKYAASHTKDGNRIIGASPIKDQLVVFPRAVKAYVTNDGIIKARLDKDFQKHEILNPELKSFVDPNYGNLRPETQMAPQGIKNFMATKMFGNDKVYNKDIPSYMINGGRNYKKQSFGQHYDEIKDNIFGKESDFSKLRRKGKIGSNKTVRQNIKNGKNIGLINSGLSLGMLGGIGYSLLAPD